jgi:hypothetical protein
MGDGKHELNRSKVSSAKDLVWKYNYLARRLCTDMDMRHLGIIAAKVETVVYVSSIISLCNNRFLHQYTNHMQKSTDIPGVGQ